MVGCGSVFERGRGGRRGLGVDGEAGMDGLQAGEARGVDVVTLPHVAESLNLRRRLYPSAGRAVEF